MNDVAKQVIAERVLNAIKAEGLTKIKAGWYLDIKPLYLSMIGNKSQWDKMSSDVWEKLQKWTNSGYSIVNWNKHRLGTEISDIEKGKPIPHEDAKTNPEIDGTTTKGILHYLQNTEDCETEQFPLDIKTVHDHRLFFGYDIKEPRKFKTRQEAEREYANTRIYEVAEILIDCLQSRECLPEEILEEYNDLQKKITY